MVRNRTYIVPPDDWVVATIDELSKVPLRNGLYKEQSEYGSGFPMIHMGDVFSGENIIDCEGMQLVALTDREKNNFVTRCGDLVFARRSLKPEGAGDIALIQTDEEMTYESSVIRVRTDGTKANSGFVSAYLNSAFGKAQMMTIVRIVAVSGITGTDLKNFQVPLPPIPEQLKIADIFSTWDRAIETSKALLATARSQKRALMQKLLTGKRRFPEFAGQEWKEVRLGEMGKTISGGTPDSTVGAYWDGDVHWATPTDITKLTSRFIRGTSRMITKTGLKDSSAKMVPAGAILICTRATIGEMAIATGPICTNQGFKNLVLNKDYDSDFVFYLLQFFKNDLIRYASGSTFLELSKKDFDKRSFMVPTLPEQRRIAEVITIAEDQIDEHRQSIAKLRIEKKALMQQLLTGKRRVNVEVADAV